MEYNDIYYELLKGNGMELLYEKFHKIIWTSLLTATDDSMLIEEVEMSIYYKIMKNIFNVQKAEAFKSYVDSIIKNEIINTMKKEGRVKKYTCMDLETLESKMAEIEDKRVITFDEVHDYLQIEEAYILSSYIKLQLTFRDIADTMEMSETTVRRKYWESIDKIRESLKDLGYVVIPKGKDRRKRER